MAAALHRDHQQTPSQAERTTFSTWLVSGMTELSHAKILRTDCFWLILSGS